MNDKSAASNLKRDLRRLIRSMDFVSRHPALKRGGPAAGGFAEIYQQLGVAWEFLALQCRHRSGWRKRRDGTSACNVCGLIRGTKEQWLLLPRLGKKTIGRRAMPNSGRTFPSLNCLGTAAQIIEEIPRHVAIRQISPLHRADDFQAAYWTWGNGTPANRHQYCQKAGKKVMNQ